DADDGNVDVREDVRGHRGDGQTSQNRDEHRDDDKGVRPAKGEPDDPHALGPSTDRQLDVGLREVSHNTSFSLPVPASTRRRSPAGLTASRACEKSEALNGNGGRAGAARSAPKGE